MSNRFNRTQKLRKQTPVRMSSVLEKPSKAFMNKEIKWEDRGNRWTNKVEKVKKSLKRIETSNQYERPSLANSKINNLFTEKGMIETQYLQNLDLNDRSRQYKNRSKSKKKIGLTSTVRSLNYTHHDQQDRLYGLIQEWVHRMFPNDDGCECPQGCRQGSFIRLWGQQYRININNNVFSRLKSTQPEINNKIQIQKDINRTQPHISSFKTQKYLLMLESILKTYSLYDREVGYVQGMNIIVSGLLYHIKLEEPTFWVFVRLMQEREVRQLFLNDFQMVYEHLKAMIKVVEEWINDLYLHFQQREIFLQQVCFSWILTLMSVLINVDYMHIVHKQFIQHGWEFIYKLIISYLLYHKPSLINQQDTSNILTILSVNYGQTNTRWKEVLNIANTLKLGA